ncbi:MAG: hypothetical protein Q9163_000317 [Psora crenata]
MAKEPCTFPSQQDDVPCGTYGETNLFCNFQSADRPTPVSEATDVLQARDDETLIVRATNNKNHPMSSVRTINTKLAHPIAFNYQPGNDQSTPCHWCDDLVYGLLGLGEVNVEVIDHNDGQGYIEIGGGHIAAGYPPSRMCDMCTLQRIMVAACRIHELEPIEDIRPNDFNFDTVVDHMMPGMATLAPFHWCSVCPAPAFFKCCKKMDLGMAEGAVDGDLGCGNGCGLMLCDYCAAILIGETEGSLEALIDRLKLEKANDRFGLRADVDFLHPRGELLRRMELHSNT